MTDLVQVSDGLVIEAGMYVTFTGNIYEVVTLLGPNETKTIGADGLIIIRKGESMPFVVFPQHIGCVWSGDEETNEAGCIETNEENGETAMTNETKTEGLTLGQAMKLQLSEAMKTVATTKLVRVDDDSDILEGFNVPEWKEEWDEASSVQDKIDDYMTAVEDFNRALTKLHDKQRDLQDAGSELESALDDFIGELSDFEEKVQVPASNIIDDRIKELQDRINRLEEKKEEWEQLPKRAKDAQKLLSDMKRHIEDGSDFEEIDSSICWEDIEEAITN